MESTLSTRTLRSVYLITYSQVNESIFPTRELFAAAVEECFQSGKSSAKVLQWVCSKELHTNVGFHYHMAVKLNTNKRWLGVKTLMQTKYNVVLNFKDTHANYYDAFKYAIKEGKEFVVSSGHPDLSSAWTPTTTKASKSRKEGGKKRSINFNSSSKESSSNSKTPKRMCNLEFSDFILKMNIKEELQLYSIAKAQKEEGKTDLARFIFNKNVGFERSNRIHLENGDVRSRNRKEK